MKKRKKQSSKHKNCHLNFDPDSLSGWSKHDVWQSFLRGGTSHVSGGPFSVHDFGHLKNFQCTWQGRHRFVLFVQGLVDAMTITIAVVPSLDYPIETCDPKLLSIRQKRSRSKTNNSTSLVLLRLIGNLIFVCSVLVSLFFWYNAQTN